MDGLIKNRDELNDIRRAAQIIDDTYSAVLEMIKEGDTEKQIAEFIDAFVRLQGASGVSFETIVAFGKGGADIHHVPTDRKLEKGMLVMIDMGAVYHGYCSDFTRTFAFGEVSDKQREIYDIVYRSQKKGIEAVRAGVKCGDVDKVCRDYIDGKGYGDKFVHTTGHGVGKLIHEAPRVAKDSEDVLQNGMVITVEPGIYLEDDMGVRIEDMVIVGENVPVSRHSTELIVVNA